MAPGKTPLIVAAVAIVGIGAATLMFRGGNDGAAVDAAPDAATADRPPVDPGRGASAYATPVPGTAAGRMDRAEAMVARRQSQRAEYMERSRQMRERAERTYAAEKVDPAWAPQKESELDAIGSLPAFAQAGATPQRMDIECRSSMCRLDGAFATNGEAEDWILVYMSSVGDKLPNSVVSRERNPDGTTAVRIYGRAR